MNQQRPTSERVYGALSGDAQRRLDRARAETEAARESILAVGRARKHPLDVSRAQVRRTVAILRDARERLGLSLADVEARSGLKCSSLSRLEHDPAANPTCLTLQRYALAVGMQLEVTLRTSGDGSVTST